METILNIALVVLTAIMPVLATWLMLWLKEKYGMEKIKQVEAELLLINDIACRAVRLAEDLIQGSGKGMDRLDAACEWMEHQLAERGIELDIEDIEFFIRAAFNEAKLAIEAARRE